MTRDCKHGRQIGKCADCEVEMLQERIDADEALMLQALATLRWNCFGECRTEGYEGTTLAADTAEALRKRLEKT